VEERRVRIAALFEWIVAAAGVALLVWVISVPVQRALGPRVEAALVEIPSGNPPGVPASASNVPVMLFGDGREIRHGELQSRLRTLLPDRLADGPPHVSSNEFGERHTRAYLVDGIRFYVVCERAEAGGPMRIAGIYLP
jgi:hypothetical protein